MKLLERSYLKRLDPSFYRGNSYVHWTHTMDKRKRGWLSPEFHFEFREILFHTHAIYDVWTIAYCIMPDHIHILWGGMEEESDQRKACAWLRRRVNQLLARTSPNEVRLQKQAYDHVLREKERDRFQLESLCHYIWGNPERAESSQNDLGTTYAGSVIPGSIPLSWTNGTEPPKNFWEQFWERHAKELPDYQ